jgi:signal recognition particle subunit SRP54
MGGGGFSGGKKKTDKKSKGSKSGNPAKRAAENSGLDFGSEKSSGSGSAFGL